MIVATASKTERQVLREKETNKRTQGTVKIHRVFGRTSGRLEVRRSDGTLQPPLRLTYDHMLTKHEDADIVKRFLACESSSCSEATNDDQHKEWQQAINEEVLALQEHETWQILPSPKHPPGGYRLQVGLQVEDQTNAKEEKYKYLFEAKGFQQKLGIDFDEIFAPLQGYSILAYCSPVHTHDIYLWLGEIWRRPSSMDSSMKQVSWDHIRTSLIPMSPARVQPQLHNLQTQAALPCLLEGGHSSTTMMSTRVTSPRPSNILQEDWQTKYLRSCIRRRTVNNFQGRKLHNNREEKVCEIKCPEIPGASVRIFRSNGQLKRQGRNNDPPPRRCYSTFPKQIRLGELQVCTHSNAEKCNSLTERESGTGEWYTVQRSNWLLSVFRFVSKVGCCLCSGHSCTVLWVAM